MGMRTRDEAAEDASTDAIELLQGFVQEVIRRCRSGDSRPKKPWCLYTKDGRRVLGRHPSRASAARQERAVKAHGG